MDKTNESAARVDVQDDIIELGVASVETKGGGIVIIEALGDMPGAGISEE